MSTVDTEILHSIRWDHKRLSRSFFKVPQPSTMDDRCLRTIRTGQTTLSESRCPDSTHNELEASRIMRYAPTESPILNTLALNEEACFSREDERKVHIDRELYWWWSRSKRLEKKSNAPMRKRAHGTIAQLQCLCSRIKGFESSLQQRASLITIMEVMFLCRNLGKGPLLQ